MYIFSKVADVKDFLHKQKQVGRTIGFVPTMGALHKGHISLIERAKNENDLCVCSIFVNPLQFNNPDDFSHYPIQTEKDQKILRQKGCDVVFCPDNKEMYPKPIKKEYDFGMLDKVMEGASRPGHFNGVAIVVNRLFNIIDPDRAYFGEKDYQQLQIIISLLKQEKSNIKIIPCPIIRDSDGLALSSRNALLSKHEREIVPMIASTLRECTFLAKDSDVKGVKFFVREKISAIPELRLDYFEIADETTLQPVNNWSDSKNIRAFIAVYVGKVRLIDNMKFIL